MITSTVLVKLLSIEIAKNEKLIIQIKIEMPLNVDKVLSILSE